MSTKKITALSPIPLADVEFDNGFLAQRQQANREVSIPAVYRQCQKSGRFEVWKLDVHTETTERPHIFWDSDVAKWLESAAHSLASHPDEQLEKQADALIDSIAAAQQADGYLNTYFTVFEPALRWANLRDWHELYCAGHLIEAAVAYRQATGKRKLLEVLCRYADYIDTVFGTESGKKRGYPGHQEIELALVRLFRATGVQKYLRLAKYFVDERGKKPHYFDEEAVARGDDPANYWAKTHAYTQSDMPVREQSVPVGHAVRGMYLYCAMADLAVEYNDAALLAACKRIFAHTVGKRMYITGGLGSTKANEGYTEDYDLPNDTAYAETCAAIGLVFFAHRLLQIERDAKYADILERALYNNVLSGVSLSGGRFFYENPLASRGDHRRWQWHHCVCCPPNVTRLLASLGSYAYSHSDAEIFVHLYVSGRARFHLRDGEVEFRQQTEYPWDGKIALTVEQASGVAFSLALRIPGWCRQASVTINGTAVADLPGEKGYAKLQRRWQPGDVVELLLEMPVEVVEAHPAVRQNAGRVALQRGPLVYCLEEADNGKNLQDIVLAQNPAFRQEFVPDVLGGVVVISGKAVRRKATGWENALYRSDKSELDSFDFKAIPYFAWANREPGEMIVWLHRASI